MPQKKPLLDITQASIIRIAQEYGLLGKENEKAFKEVLKNLAEDVLARLDRLNSFLDPEQQGITIRPAEPSDATAIAELEIENWVDAYSHIAGEGFFNDVNFAEREKAWDSALDPSNKSEFTHVAVINNNGDEEIVGFCLYRFPKAKEEKSAMRISKMHVQEEYRGKGIATAFIETCKEFALEKGFKYLDLSSLIKSDSALLYPKQAFYPTEHESSPAMFYGKEVWEGYPMEFMGYRLPIDMPLAIALMCSGAMYKIGTNETWHPGKEKLVAWYPQNQFSQNAAERFPTKATEELFESMRKIKKRDMESVPQRNKRSNYERWGRSKAKGKAAKRHAAYVGTMGGTTSIAETSAAAEARGGSTEPMEGAHARRRHRQYQRSDGKGREGKACITM
jgi:GNAT superfamily N-acetyltransferase